MLRITAWLLFLSLGTNACGLLPGSPQGTDNHFGAALNVPPIVQIPSPSAPVGKVVGDSCTTEDPEHLCLGIRYVVYHDSNGNPIVSADQAAANVRAINQVWSQCNLGFEIEDYLPINPADYGLQFRAANLSELDQVRGRLAHPSLLMVATTGTWNRSGTLGYTGANAWTAMPGGGPFGAVLEQPVAFYPNLIGHELGHYLNLEHLNDNYALMNPIIYSNSTNVYPDECDMARRAAAYFWPGMLR